MAVYRKIETSFWAEDSFVLDLTKDQKYFYIFLFTNPNVNQSGCYEISKRTMSFQTGFSIEEIDELLAFFCAADKIKFDPKTSEILIKNWLKYNGSDSPKIIKNIFENIEKIKNSEFKKYCIDTLLILYPRVADTEKYSMHTETQEKETKEETKEEYKNNNTGARTHVCNFNIQDLLRICEEKSPVIFSRHTADAMADYRLGQILDEISTSMTLDEIGQLLEHANKTYIVKPKYKNLDLCWVMNNIQSVKQAEEITTQIIPSQREETQLEAAAKRLGVSWNK